MSESRPDQLSEASSEHLSEDTPETIELENAEGEVLVFELLAVVEVQDQLFAALTPHVDELPEGQALDLHIFHYEEFPPDDSSPDGYWSVEPVQDEALEEQVFDEVQQLLISAASEEG
jgi:hypothetical protein